MASIESVLKRAHALYELLGAFPLPPIGDRPGLGEIIVERFPGHRGLLEAGMFSAVEKLEAEARELLAGAAQMNEDEEQFLKSLRVSCQALPIRWERHVTAQPQDIVINDDEAQSAVEGVLVLHGNLRWSFERLLRNRAVARDFHLELKTSEALFPEFAEFDTSNMRTAASALLAFYDVVNDASGFSGLQGLREAFGKRIAENDPNFAKTLPLLRYFTVVAVQLRLGVEGLAAIVSNDTRGFQRYRAADIELDIRTYLFELLALHGK